jgi:recombination protein RecA
MAKKLVKASDELVLSAIDKMYAKYRKTDQIFEAPKKLEDIDLSVERMKSPLLSFDRHLGGAPAYGKITTYNAFASCGKTSLALAFAGANPDKIIGFCDNEFNWTDSSYLWIDKYFGIEKERIHVLQPTYLEEGAEMVEDLCGVADIVIFDGFDSLAPKAEYQATMEEQQMGAQARAYKKFFRRSMGKIYKSKAALIVTNHLYDNIGKDAVYEPLKAPGGRSILDFSSQMLNLTRGNIFDKDKKIIGQDVRVEIKKDKLSGNRGVKFSLPYDNKLGFDVEKDIVNNAIDLGVINVAGSWYSYSGTKLGQGIDTVVDLMRDNPELCLEVVTLCKERF